MADLKRRKLAPNHRGGRNPQQNSRAPRRPPGPPPAYLQRDLLLIADGEQVKGLNEVRAKFDPLSKKVPVHVTLLFPEPAQVLKGDFLKQFPKDNLPSLDELTFVDIFVHDEMYLWLVPDEEAKSKLTAWHQALKDNLQPQKLTQDEVYIPHMTLGYVPRSLTPEDATTFAKQQISLPLTLKFGKLLLEEFAENQISKEIDALTFQG